MITNTPFLAVQALPSYLLKTLFTATPPQSSRNPQWLAYNHAVADILAIPAAQRQTPETLQQLSGNAWPADCPPSASVYAGHQFGQWAGQLGDGRAHTLGTLNGYELQLKGAGRTPYSRGADGRAVLRSSIREYLASAAMQGLGIPTTMALALIGSDESVQRETLERGAIVTRVAASHLRFGHFEYLAWRDDPTGLAALAAEVMARHYPECTSISDWLSTVITRTATLVAQWQTVGFCHGVMNTDNFSVLGLTLDYGPFGFMDGFNAQHICNHSDDAGRYAYDQQPQIGYFNCAKLLTACLSLLDSNHDIAIALASELLKGYAPAYSAVALMRWSAKLGFAEPAAPELINGFLTLMHRCRADFSQSFRQLSQVRMHDTQAQASRIYFNDPAAYDRFIDDYRAHLQSQGLPDAARAEAMNRVNPLYVLRNHHAQRVINAAENGDYAPITRWQQLLAQPFNPQPFAHAEDALPPAAEEASVCVSCSS